MIEYMQDNLDFKKIAHFSFYSAFVNLFSASFTFPLNKMNIRAKAGVSDTTHQSLFKQFRNFYRVQRLRGMYQGASLLPLAIVPINFVQNFVYQSINHYCKRQSFFINNPKALSLMPILSVIAVTPIACVNAAFSMVFSIIHSQKLSNMEAIKTAMRKDKKVFIESFKLTALNMIVLMGTRQFVYQHVIRELKSYKLPTAVNLLITSTVVGVLVGVIYQPFEVILTLLAVGEKGKYQNDIFKIIKAEGWKSLLTKGIKFRLLISMIISVTGIPVYSQLKHQFNLNLYI